jgi:hypothetical protein
MLISPLVSKKPGPIYRDPNRACISAKIEKMGDQTLEERETGFGAIITASIGLGEASRVQSIPRHRKDCRIVENLKVQRVFRCCQVGRVVAGSYVIEAFGEFVVSVQ